MDEKIVNAIVDGSVFRSCRELKRHSLHTLCLHRCSQLDTPIWSRLVQLRDQGVIGRLGISVQSVEECTSALNNKDVKHIQLPLNLLDWRWRTSEFLALCKSRSDVIFNAVEVYYKAFWLTIQTFGLKLMESMQVKWLQNWMDWWRNLD